jgi:hypothetical protein
MIEPRTHFLKTLLEDMQTFQLKLNSAKKLVTANPQNNSIQRITFEEQ